MSHTGSLEYGQGEMAVVNDTPIISVVQLEDPSKIKVVRVDNPVFNVVLDDSPYTVLAIEPDVINAEIVDEVYTVSVVDTQEVITEFDESQIQLYNAYGNASSAQLVLNSLGTLVNVKLPNGTNGLF
ncbi:MAG: hypothetical protein ACKO0Z_25250 [Betaproteobacteria bacterium]